MDAFTVIVGIAKLALTVCAFCCVPKMNRSLCSGKSDEFIKWSVVNLACVGFAMMGMMVLALHFFGPGFD